MAFGGFALAAGLRGDQADVDGVRQGAVENDMDVADRRGAQATRSVALAALEQLPIERVQLPDRDGVDGPVTETRKHME